MSKAIFIGGNRWRVRMVSRIKWPEGTPRKRGVVAWGMTDADRKEIQIRDDIGDQDAMQTFVHELLHAIGMECQSVPTLFQLGEDHDAINRLASELTGALRQVGVLQA